jgi:hypothetical protein
MNEPADQCFTDTRLSKNQDMSAAVCQRNERAAYAADPGVSANELGVYDVGRLGRYVYPAGRCDSFSLTSK